MKEYQERVAYVLEHVPAHCKAELTELLSTPPEQQAPGAGLSEECQPLVERAAQAHARETGAGGAPAGERPARGGAAAGGAPKRAAKAAGAKAPKPTRAPRGARRGGRYFSTETTIAVTVVALTLVPIGALVLYAFWRASARKVAAAAALEKIKTEDAEAWEAALAEAVAEEARRAKRAAAEEKEIKAGRKRPAAAQPAPGGAGLPGMPALGQ